MNFNLENVFFHMYFSKSTYFQMLLLLGYNSSQIIIIISPKHCTQISKNFGVPEVFILRW